MCDYYYHGISASELPRLVCACEGGHCRLCPKTRPARVVLCNASHHRHTAATLLLLRADGHVLTAQRRPGHGDLGTRPGSTGTSCRATSERRRSAWCCCHRAARALDQAATEKGSKNAEPPLPPEEPSSQALAALGFQWWARRDSNPRPADEESQTAVSGGPRQTTHARLTRTPRS